MNWLELLNEIFQTCIIPLLGILTTYIVRYIQIKTAEVQQHGKNELTNKYLTMLKDTVVDCLTATNQTYVETLKKEGKFDTDAQKVAFEKTKDAVMTILTQDAKECLTTAVGDLNVYVSQLIESKIKTMKP